MLFRSAHIHPAARVHPEADLRGPVYVDAEAVIEKNATVIGPAHIGRGCRVAGGAVVCRSIVPEGQCVRAESPRGRVRPRLGHGFLRRWFSQSRSGWRRVTAPPVEAPHSTKSAMSSGGDPTKIG